MPSPGAVTSTSDPKLLKLANCWLLSLAPTEIAPAMPSAAGYSALFTPSLPAATTMTTPLPLAQRVRSSSYPECEKSVVGSSGLEEWQLASFAIVEKTRVRLSVPRLMLITCAPSSVAGLPSGSIARNSASAKTHTLPSPFSSRTRYGTIFASGAVNATRPATCVPCPKPRFAAVPTSDVLVLLSTKL